ncbi:hypothetical protein [Stenotrophomonas sp. Ker107b]
MSVTLTLGDEELHFVKVEGDRVHCLGLDGDGHFSVEQIISIYDAWRANPKIEDYWGLGILEWEFGARRRLGQHWQHLCNAEWSTCWNSGVGMRLWERRRLPLLSHRIHDELNFLGAGVDRSLD